MGNNFSSKYELFRNVKADDKKGMNKNYGIFLVLRRKTGSGSGKGSISDTMLSVMLGLGKSNIYTLLSFVIV